ncbi:MAG: hypothetical protein ACWA6V_07525 [Cellvibrio sp.]
MNISQTLFEKWCPLIGGTSQAIPESEEENVKTPDYLLKINNVNIYAEIKEINATKDEEKILEALKNNKDPETAYGEEPGKTVRQNITSGYNQLKLHCETKNCCGILVFFNNSGMPGLGRFDHHHILHGMFGSWNISIYPQETGGKIINKDRDFLGGKKSLTKDHKKYLSGILNLTEHHSRGLIGFLYHNLFALHPLDKKLFNSKHCTQYIANLAHMRWELPELKPQ